MAIIQSEEAYSGATRPTVRVAGRSFTGNSSAEAQRKAEEYIRKRRSTPRVNTGNSLYSEESGGIVPRVAAELPTAATARPMNATAQVPRPVETARAGASVPRPAPSPENPLGLNLSNLELMRRRQGLTGGSGSSVKNKQVQAQIAEERRLAEAERVRMARATEQGQALDAQQQALTDQLQGAENVAAIEAGGKISAAQAAANAKIQEAKLTLEAKQNQLIYQGLAIGTPEFDQRMQADLAADLSRAEQAGNIEQQNMILRAQLEAQKAAKTTIEDVATPDGMQTTRTQVIPGEITATPTAESTSGFIRPTAIIPDESIASLDGEPGISERDQQIQAINNAIVSRQTADGKSLSDEDVKFLLQRLKELRAVKPAG